MSKTRITFVKQENSLDIARDLIQEVVESAYRGGDINHWRVESCNLEPTLPTGRHFEIRGFIPDPPAEPEDDES